MKLIVDRSIMLSNVEVAESLVGSASIALMFKDFYADFYDDRFSNYVCYGSKVSANRMVTNNIKDQSKAYGKMLISEDDIANHIQESRIYIPINLYDNREGLSTADAYSIVRRFKKYSGRITLLITSGCINDKCPVNSEIEDLWYGFKDYVSGISVGGSFYLNREIPDCVREVRIGEYMILGTIPYSSPNEKFSEPAIMVETQVLAVYPDRNHILTDGGWSSIDTHNCQLISEGLEYVHNSCDYTIYTDKDRKYAVGDTVYMIPDYNSLVKMQNVGRKYSK